MGEAGAGQLTKMVNQICIAGLVQALVGGAALRRSRRARPRAGGRRHLQGRRAILADGEPLQDDDRRQVRFRLRRRLDAQGPRHLPRRGARATARACRWRRWSTSSTPTCRRWAAGAGTLQASSPASRTERPSPSAVRLPGVTTRRFGGRGRRRGPGRRRRGSWRLDARGRGGTRRFGPRRRGRGSRRLHSRGGGRPRRLSPRRRRGGTRLHSRGRSRPGRLRPWRRGQGSRRRRLPSWSRGGPGRLGLRRRGQGFRRGRLPPWGRGARRRWSGFDRLRSGRLNRLGRRRRV